MSVSYSIRTAVLFLIVLIAAELAVSMVLNHGAVVYTLDDPYIHLSLAQHISMGHYGVNANEFSAPSSSILWPFLLAPFARFEVGVYAPLVLNIAFALATVCVFVRIVELSIGPGFSGLTVWFAIILVLATNVVGLVFTGLEHSLQLFLTAATVLGLAIEAEDGTLENWLLAAIVLGPLVRYENMCVSLVALLYLFVRGYYRTAVALGALIAVLLGSFSLFLVSLGLDWLPTSIMAKSTVLDAAGHPARFALHLRDSLTNDRGAYLMVCLLLLLGYAAFGARGRKRTLAAIVPMAIALHMLVGQYGWYNRYEIYIWTFGLLVNLYVFGDAIRGLLLRSEGRVSASLKTAAVAGLVVSLVCYRYLISLGSLPIASNNTYEQQFQMRRFAVDFYGAPIAVNDLGYVSWHNGNYVLDLFGLGSKQALTLRFNREDSEWMDEMARARGVGLVMIYDTWVKEHVPRSWIKVGELEVHGPLITVERTVSFYALTESAKQATLSALDRFRGTLPPEAEFVYAGTDVSPHPVATVAAPSGFRP